MIPHPTLRAALIACALLAAAQAPEATAQVTAAIANPGEQASTEARLCWHTPQGKPAPAVFYAAEPDGPWRKARAEMEPCEVFDSMYSKRASGENFHESARLLRHTASLRDLEPGTRYKYRIEGDTALRFFQTAPAAGGFRAAIISDFHAYPPLPGRQAAAMAMLDTLRAINGAPFDLMLHLGDVCAWGGSYSFWQELYSEPAFKHYTWAGVNGNHDNMDRTGKRNSPLFFRSVNNNPANGYEGQEGVCYWFRYGDVLFLALNSEAMRSAEGLAAAQAWVKEVVEAHPAPYVVVMEHYQWFFGQNGKDSQYGRWSELFDTLGVDLALGANNHRYAATPPLRGGEVVGPGQGTVYIQSPSSDNDRGVDIDSLTHNATIIRARWTEGLHTVGAMIMDATPEQITVTLYDRHGRELDRSVAVRRDRILSNPE